MGNIILKFKNKIFKIVYGFSFVINMLSYKLFIQIFNEKNHNLKTSEYEKLK